MGSMAKQFERRELDLDDYEHRSRSGPCFICQVIDGAHEFAHGEIYRDGVGVAFLSRYPTLLGYTLVAPLEHRCGVVGDFELDEYLELQALVHRVGRAIASAVPTERLYVLSLGSNEGNAHVHWHLAPLPPGVPYAEQQCRALMIETRGYIHLTETDRAALAVRIRAALLSMTTRRVPWRPDRLPMSSP